MKPDAEVSNATAAAFPGVRSLGKYAVTRRVDIGNRSAGPGLPRRVSIRALKMSPPAPFSNALQQFTQYFTKDCAAFDLQGRRERV